MLTWLQIYDHAICAKTKLGCVVGESKHLQSTWNKFRIYFANVCHCKKKETWLFFFLIMRTREVGEIGCENTRVTISSIYLTTLL